MESVIESCIDYCNKNVIDHKKEPVEIEYDISRKYSMGGTSSYNGKKYTIKINIGVLERIKEIYSVLLHENNKSFYSKISLEIDFDDEKAGAYFSILVRLSLNFIIFHELAHIFNGHLKFLYSEKLSTVNFNLIHSNNNEISPLFSQTLEMNADAFAATHCLSIITYPETIKLYNIKDSEIIKGKPHAYLLFFFGSGILFSELGMGNSRESIALDKLYYLPLRTRYDTMIRCSTAAYVFLNPEEKIRNNVFNPLLLRKMVSNTELFHSMLRIEQGESPTNYHVRNNIEEISEKYIKHADAIFNYWTHSVRAKLLPYSVFDLPL